MYFIFELNRSDFVLILLQVVECSEYGLTEQNFVFFEVFVNSEFDGIGKIWELQEPRN